jgi:hypothetical protein
MEQELTPQTISQNPLHEPGKPGKTSSQKVQRNKLLMIVLAVTVGILFITTIVFAMRASTTQNNLDAKYNGGYQDGSAAQKSKDEKQFASDTIKDTRTYTAPESYGSFELTLPKSYSLWVNPNQNGNINGVANPNVVDGKSDIQAFRFNQATNSFDSEKRRYDGLAKQKGNNITTEEVIVSGIKGLKYTGKIDQKTKLESTYIILPVRDKVVTLQTDSNKDYLEAFNAIVKQLKLNP